MTEMQDAPVTQQAPTAPATIRIEAGPTTAAQTIAIPQNATDITGLRSRRAELSDQLQRAVNRRDGIITDMRQASGAERGGLEQRLAALDSRIVQIEGDIAATERALTNAPASVLGAAAQAEQAAEDARDANRSAIDNEAFIAIPVVFTMFVLFPIAIAYARRIWRRAPAMSALPAATEGRLERIEQAVEAIAVEVERVSEGQRFVTRLMSESKVAPGLPASPPRP